METSAIRHMSSKTKSKSISKLVIHETPPTLMASRSRSSMMELDPKRHAADLSPEDLKTTIDQCVRFLQRLCGDTMWRRCVETMRINRKTSLKILLGMIAGRKQTVDPVLILPWMITKYAKHGSDRRLTNWTNFHGLFGDILWSELTQGKIVRKKDLNQKGRAIHCPLILAAAINYLLQDKKVKMDGIFRTPGSFKRIKSAWGVIETEFFKNSEVIDEQKSFQKIVDDFSLTAHDVAGIISFYFHNVWTTPLMSYELYESWVTITYHTLVSKKKAGSSTKLDHIRKGRENPVESFIESKDASSIPGFLPSVWQSLMLLLPEENRCTLELLARFLNVVARFDRENRMDSKNLALVFAPLILCHKEWEKFLYAQDLTIAIVRRMIDVPDNFFELPEANVLASDSTLGRKNNSSIQQRMSIDVINNSTGSELNNSTKRKSKSSWFA